MKIDKLIGVLDIGSNSIMLTVAIADTVKPTILTEFCKVTKLGENSATTGELQQDAMERTTKAVTKFVRQAHSMGVRDFVGTATSAVRDAENGSAFIKELSSQIGFTPQILSGPEEADAVFRGTTAGLKPGRKIITCDPGGGSTEINIGITGDHPFFGHSYNVGCVRHGDRYNLYDTVKPEDIELARKDIFDSFTDAFKSIDNPEEYDLYISSGTATTFAAVKMAMIEYNREKVHHSNGTLEEMEMWIKKLFAIPLCERAKIPGLGERAPMLPTGMLIMAEVMKGFGKKEFTVSTNALRYGMLLKASEKLLKD
jgi:exopolyphosphatase/guanosine-5'-triphosphate,3'-diphosphate pyrophosphatase